MKTVNTYLFFGSVGALILLIIYAYMKRNAIAGKLIDEQLTHNFKLSELTTTDTGILNLPNEKEKENLRMLAKYVLQPVRDLLGIPIYVNSAFRSEAVNKKVGGVKESQHRQGFAADIRVKDMDLMAAYVKIAKSGIPYDQLIYEIKPSSKWIHISYNPDSKKMRRQLLLAEWNGSKMVYKSMTV